MQLRFLLIATLTLKHVRKDDTCGVNFDDNLARGGGNMNIAHQGRRWSFEALDLGRSHPIPDRSRSHVAAPTSSL